MSPAPGTLSDTAHDEEVALQKKIVEDIVPDETPAASEVVETVDPSPEEAAAEVQPVVVAPAPGATFPLRITAVGIEDELVFDAADSTVEVDPEVAEQFTYLPAVEVAA